MRTRFYYPTARRSGRTQGIVRKQKKVKLTKEARAAIKIRQREASRRYKQDLDEAWAKIDEATENLAATHHKSVRRVQSELHTGPNMARKRRLKTSAWNAFCWKKNISLKEAKTVVGDESRHDVGSMFYFADHLLLLDTTASGESAVDGMY
jgi:hypothetical protein